MPDPSELTNVVRKPRAKVTRKLALEDLAVEPVEFNGRYVIEQRADGVALGIYAIDCVVPDAGERLERSRSGVAQGPPAICPPLVLHT